jgi:hypothetical protein
VAKILIINLEAGYPTANQALLRLEFELRQAREQGAREVKLIHGYGSSGVGGVLREAVQQHLRQLQEAGQIRDFVAGENWRTSNETAWKISRLMPEMKRDRDFNRGNRGITVVLL